jgi:hypothetical protein
VTAAPTRNGFIGWIPLAISDRLSNRLRSSKQ